MGTNGKGRGAVPSSGVEAETNGEVGGAAPPLASKRGQTEREEGRSLSGIETGTNGEGRGLPPPLVLKRGQMEREEGCLH